MDKKAAETEILYRLCKLVLANMVNDGLITEDSAETACLSIRDELNPIIGCLDEGLSNE